QSSSRFVPLAAIEGAIGDFILGAAITTTARSERFFRSPTQLGLPPETFGKSFQYRYAGLSAGYRRDTVAIGAARRLGDTVAVGADLWWFPRRALTTEWQLDGVTVVDTTTLGATRLAELPTLPSRVSSRTHGALRAALDVELIAGFLWATGGYAYTTAGTSG